MQVVALAELQQFAVNVPIEVQVDTTAHGEQHQQIAPYKIALMHRIINIMWGLVLHLITAPSVAIVQMLLMENTILEQPYLVNFFVPNQIV